MKIIRCVRCGKSLHLPVDKFAKYVFGNVNDMNDPYTLDLCEECAEKITHILKINLFLEDNIDEEDS